MSLLAISTLSFLTSLVPVLAHGFKLSDLPVLKKWEIPFHHFSKHVGRKYKDLENLDAKRSHYWEIRPDFTANELDWDEDPEKLKLDFNYKSFFDDDDDSATKGKQVSGKRSKIKKKPFVDEPVDKAFVRSLIISNVSNAPKKKKQAKKHKRSRRSNDPFEGTVFADDEWHTVENEDGNVVSFFDERDKRDTISDFLKHANKPSEKVVAKRKDVPTKTKAHTTAKEEPTQLELSRRTAEQILKRKTKDGVLGDEHPVAKSNIKVPDVNEKPVKLQKNSMVAKLQDVKATTRERIDHPKDKFNMDIVPSNVARAVAMAMEQLKRDKMWGKVFVHVRPSGQLKVMVQETRKMEDESNNK